MRAFILLLLLGGALTPRLAANSPLLQRAAEKWLADVDHWAFTVRVREFAHGAVKEERIEHYDPAKPERARWELESVNGRPPTDERRTAWLAAKAKRHGHGPKSVADYFDFENARLIQATPRALRYHLPLRSNHDWLFPVEHVALTVTLDRPSNSIGQIEAGIAEPMDVALGIERILDVDLDLKINSLAGHGPAGTPQTSRPEGQAEVVVSRLGERIEYSWSDFHRVD